MNSYRRQKALAYFRTKEKFYDKATGLYKCFCGGQDCKGKLTEKEVRVEHKNNDNGDDRPRNIRPASHSCNIRIGFIQRKKYPKTKRETPKYSEPPATMQKNIEIKKIAKPWLNDHITGGIRLSKAEVVRRIAFRTDANIKTIERLLEGLIVNEEPSCPFEFIMDDDEIVYIQQKKFLGPS